MYVFTLRYKLEGVAFYANKIPGKRTSHSDLQECRVTSHVNLGYNFDQNLQFTSTSAIDQIGRRESWCRFVYRLVARVDPRIYPFVPRSALLCSVACRSPIIVLSLPKRCSGSGFVR